MYKGTLDQCGTDLKSHADQQQRAHEHTLNAAAASYSLIKDGENGSGIIDNLKLIYEINEDGEQGNKIGYIKDSEPFFYADEKE